MSPFLLKQINLKKGSSCKVPRYTPSPSDDKVIIPERLAILAEKDKVSIPIFIHYDEFKGYLMKR